MDIKKDKEQYGLKNIDKNNVSDDRYFVHVVKRTEKLSEALYMVTSLVADTEPLKWEIRKESVSLVTGVARLRAVSFIGRADAFSGIEDFIDSILALLKIARAGGVVSEMNAGVLIREYEVLAEAIKNKKKATDLYSEIITNSVLRDELPEDVINGKSESAFIKDTLYKGQDDVLYRNKEQNVLEKEDKHLSYFKRTPATSISSKRQSASEQTKKPATVVMDKQYRKKTIIDFVKKMKEVSVKDIAVVISDCSEKTIQRELIALVNEGVLKKKGEKRWSRYRMKN